jgi:antitoxin ParD1/3/4
MLPTRINARLSGGLAAFVAKMVSASGVYETPSEYIRDLIRRDMEQKEGLAIRESILDGYRDFAEGRFFASTGNFPEDMKVFQKKKKSGWK